MEWAPVGVLLCCPDESTTTPAMLRTGLGDAGVRAPFAGWVPGTDDSDEREILLAVLERTGTQAPAPAPSGFRVVAFVPTYNEADVISHTLEYLTAQGIEVYVIDNWSTDDTVDRVEAYVGRGVIGIERYPADRPAGTYEWRQILTRIEHLAGEIDAHWYMLHDADERRHTPWPGVLLRDGLQYVDTCGFTCVDHVVVNFWPTENRFDSRRDVEDQLRYFSFSSHPGHFHQRKAWKRTRRPASIAASAGHDVCFPGRLVYPFKFLIKHYPVRSEEHGRRKVLLERAPRWSPAERALGWHQQYDDVPGNGTFIRDRATLEYFEEPIFSERYLVERLSGVGVFPEAPWWATGPRQSFMRG